MKKYIQHFDYAKLDVTTHVIFSCQMQTSETLRKGENMVSVTDVREMAAMDMLFRGDENSLKEHIEYVKKEIYSELEKLEDKHYFCKWCKDNWELFNKYEFKYGCITTEVGKSAIYGNNVESKKLIITISNDKSARIFFKEDKVFKFRCAHY